MRTVLHAHLKEGSYRREATISIVLHVALVLFFTFGMIFLPAPPPIELGLGEGGGQGDFVSVGLAADVGGGEGMVKPPVTPRADSAPPPPPAPAEPPAEPEEVPEEVFTETKEPPKPKPPEPRRPPPQQTEEPKPTREGLIPRAPDPGKGPAAGGGGSGGGFGTGRGVSVGSGAGAEGTIDSWYVRQVEQRVGDNWFQTSLGDSGRVVEAVATFVVNPNGQITDVQLEKSSGIGSVDLAVQRAIHASNPLPPLPFELRGRTVRFRAVFQYPPVSR
jgi:TonB family protein